MRWFYSCIYVLLVQTNQRLVIQSVFDDCLSFQVGRAQLAKQTLTNALHYPLAPEKMPIETVKTKPQTRVLTTVIASLGGNCPTVIQLWTFAKTSRVRTTRLVRQKILWDLIAHVYLVSKVSFKIYEKKWIRLFWSYFSWLTNVQKVLKDHFDQVYETTARIPNYSNIASRLFCLSDIPLFLKNKIKPSMKTSFFEWFSVFCEYEKNYKKGRFLKVWQIFSNFLVCVMDSWVSNLIASKVDIFLIFLSLIRVFDLWSAITETLGFFSVYSTWDFEHL